ncbi:MAG: thioesterase family protein [Pseudomonadales bacterium]
MSRVVIDLPEEFPFSTDIEILVSHINRGDHLANEAIIAFANEAWVRYLRNLGIDDFVILGSQTINADLAVSLHSEGLYGEIARIDVVPANFHKYGCDFLFRICDKTSGRLIAKAKMGLLTYDYSEKKLQLAPEGFAKALMP